MCGLCKERRRVLNVLIVLVDKYSEGFSGEKYYNRVCVAFVNKKGVCPKCVPTAVAGDRAEGYGV